MMKVRNYKNCEISRNLLKVVNKVRQCRMLNGVKRRYYIYDWLKYIRLTAAFREFHSYHIFIIFFLFGLKPMEECRQNVNVARLFGVLPSLAKL